MRHLKTSLNKQKESNGSKKESKGSKRQEVKGWFKPNVVVNIGFERN